MQKKNIIVSGCSSGIGRYVAKALMNRGYHVFATARKPHDVEDLLSRGFDVEQMDLASSVSVETAVESIMSRADGKIYGLFNNAAYGQPGAVEDLSREVLQEQFETNLFGTHQLTNLVIPVMRKRGKGRIIHNSSVLGLVGLNYRGAYVASKYALEGLTDTLRLELNGTGIHVSLIEPGPIRSFFRDNALVKYKEHIDRENSAHKEIYKAMEAKLSVKGDVTGFTLGPDAVYEKVLHALESRRPRARYSVTKPTYVFAALKRVLPDWVMDKILLAVSRQEHR